MFTLKAVFLALVVQSCEVYSQSLRTGIQRDLSQKLFLTYQPRTDVIDHSRIDLDQKEMEQQLGQETSVGFQKAAKIYSSGAYSKAYGTLTLSTVIPTTIKKGTEVSGISVIGKAQGGKLYEDAVANSRVIKVQYATTRDCQAKAVSPMVDGCFAANGWAQVGGMNFTYSYNIANDTKNARTIKGFSTAAQKKMWECDNCPYVDYRKFFNYYGRHDYADHWIMAAFEQVQTQFTKGNADFSAYQKIGQAEVIKKGAAYMNIWMYVVRELEDALDDCIDNCAFDGCNDDKVSAWDEAVAFYVGSTESKLPFTLANKRCANFGTCGASGLDTTGDAKVNLDIMNQYIIGQRNLLTGKCTEARRNKERIVNLMTVPLIQGTLRYAYIVGVQNDAREKPRAEGAVFAASILPMVDYCNANDAAIIYKNMKVGATILPRFVEVKQAFEKNYNCLGITCADVGGLLDRTSSNTEYLKYAEPCGGAGRVSSGQKSNINVQLAIGLTVGLVVLAIIVVLLFCSSWKSKSKKEFDVTNDDLPPQEGEGIHVS